LFLNNKFPAGIVTLNTRTMMPDGAAYMYLWASEWIVITNQMSGIEGLRTTDKYHLCVYNNHGQPLIIIPGCQVKGYCASNKNPVLKGGSQIYSIGTET